MDKSILSIVDHSILRQTGKLMKNSYSVYRLAGGRPFCRVKVLHTLRIFWEETKVRDGIQLNETFDCNEISAGHRHLYLYHMCEMSITRWVLITNGFLHLIWFFQQTDIIIYGNRVESKYMNGKSLKKIKNNYKTESGTRNENEKPIIGNAKCIIQERFIRNEFFDIATEQIQYKVHIMSVCVCLRVSEVLNRN